MKIIALTLAASISASSAFADEHTEFDKNLELGFLWMYRSHSDNIGLLRGSSATPIVFSDDLGSEVGPGLFANFRGQTFGRPSFSRIIFALPTTGSVTNSNLGGLGVFETSGSSFGLFGGVDPINALSERETSLISLEHSVQLGDGGFFAGLRALQITDNLNHHFTADGVPGTTSTLDLNADSLLAGPQLSYGHNFGGDSSGWSLSARASIGAMHNTSTFDVVGTSVGLGGAATSGNVTASNWSPIAELNLNATITTGRLSNISFGYNVIFAGDVASAPGSSSISAIASGVSTPVLGYENAILQSLSVMYKLSF